ncbi:peroxiredoxin [Streptomyces roseus]|uniref:thioredoxin-dependent peroxiredoxin n=1 Tax=Streptomyces roseus TaxID=66430 RepID=A0A0J6XIV1_9ACTN|nr:peroxiredoxin [Streptomyces roseus]KMO94563.1 alkyl hydroperoxide reductase [Streptomyces roseus]
MPHTPKIGDTVGEFRLPGGRLDGETFHRREYTLCEQRGKPLVLAFYPGDDTPVCTAQLCSYSDGLADLQSAGAAVWGISPQGLDSHERFARDRNLRMPLLSDEGRTVAQSFGITAPLIGLRRAVFILTATGRLHWKHVTAVGATYPPATTLSAQLATLTA